MAVTNQPPYPSANSPNAPNYINNAKGVVIVVVPQEILLHFLIPEILKSQ